MKGVVRGAYNQIYILKMIMMVAVYVGKIEYSERPDNN